MIESDRDSSYGYLEIQPGTAQKGSEDLTTRF